MSTDLLISSDPWENRVAILEDEKLVEYYVERDERVIGSIYKGKVQNVLPGMGASFIDIGLGRNAFLYVDDINKTPLNIGDVENHGWPQRLDDQRESQQGRRRPRPDRQGTARAQGSAGLDHHLAARPLPDPDAHRQVLGRLAQKIESAEERNRLQDR